MDVINEISKAKIVPVVVIEDASDAVPLSEAMIAGGINIAE